MPIALVSLPFGPLDVVGVYSGPFNQVFQDARPMRAQIRESSRPMEHPLESGQLITDYRILLPIEIAMPVIIQSVFYRDVYEEISNIYQNADILSVHTRAKIYENMILAEMPHEETSEVFDTITLVLRFKQVLIVAPVSDFVPADPEQTDTVARGEQNASTIITPDENTVTGVATTIPPAPPLTVPQTNYVISGVATLPAQTGFR